MNKCNKKGNDISCFLVSYNFPMLEVIGDEEARGGCRDLNKKKNVFRGDLQDLYLCSTG